jgi:hypothetical protein
VIAGLKRLAVLLVATSLVLGLLGALGALVAGGAVDRWVSVAYYVVGAFLLVLGFFAGMRGPLRPRGSDEGADPVTGLFGIGIATRGARRATDHERQDTLATAAIFLVVGLWLIMLGVLVDGSAGVV